MEPLDAVRALGSARERSSTVFAVYEESLSILQ